MDRFQRIWTLVCVGLFVLTLIRFPWLDAPKGNPPPAPELPFFPEDEKTAIEKAANSIGSAIRDAKPDREYRVTEYTFFLNPPSEFARPDWSMICVQWVPLLAVYIGLLPFLRARRKPSE